MDVHHLQCTTIKHQAKGPSSSKLPRKERHATQRGDMEKMLVLVLVLVLLLLLLLVLVLLLLMLVLVLLVLVLLVLLLLLLLVLLVLLLVLLLLLLAAAAAGWLLLGAPWELVRGAARSSRAGPRG
jgi:hypothetical protein